MKFRQLHDALTDERGFFPTSQLRWVIRRNPRTTSREEAIAGKIIQEANPRENITGHFPWGPEEQMVLQQFWCKQGGGEWRDVPVDGAELLYKEVKGVPVPNAVREPGQVRGDFQERLNEILGGSDEFGTD